MRISITIAALLLAFPVRAGEIQGHGQYHADFYSKLKQPKSGRSCCNDRDCRPARYRATHRGYEFLVYGRWVRVRNSKLMIEDTPDDGGHICGQFVGDQHPLGIYVIYSDYVYCAIVPKGSV